MKKLFVILICSLFAGLAGLYTRPSYILVGQLDWLDVVTKGYYVGSLAKFFTQGMIDESFFWVMKFAGSGLALGIIVTFILGEGKGSSKGSKGSKKKKA